MPNNPYQTLITYHFTFFCVAVSVDTSRSQFALAVLQLTQAVLQLILAALQQTLAALQQ
jgi:hypothetical protein